jgi:hypothetical protein
MKTLLLILLFSPLLTLGQWVENYQMQTQWAYELENTVKGSYCYFSGNKNEGEIIIKLKPFKDTLINPFFYVQTSIDMFSVYIDGINKRGFFMGKIKHYELEKIATLKYAEAIIIWVKNGKKQSVKKIMIVSSEMRKQITELITYTKPL